MIVDTIYSSAVSRAEPIGHRSAEARSEEGRRVGVAFYIVVPALVFALIAIGGLLAGWSFGSILLVAYFAQVVIVCVFIGALAARDAVSAPVERVAYIVGSTDLNFDLDVRLWSHGFRPSSCATLHDLEERLDRRKIEGLVACVDIDAAPCLVTAIDELILFRSRYPDMRVVLLSREFSGDDFSNERKPICDASLRKPVSPARLEAALAH